MFTIFIMFKIEMNNYKSEGMRTSLLALLQGSGPCMLGWSFQMKTRGVQFCFSNFVQDFSFPLGFNIYSQPIKFVVPFPLFIRI